MFVQGLEKVGHHNKSHFCLLFTFVVIFSTSVSTSEHFQKIGKWTGHPLVKKVKAHLENAFFKEPATIESEV